MRQDLAFAIDRITNSIVDVATEESFETDMVPVNHAEIMKVHKKDGWFFNWKLAFKEKNHCIYKLVLLGDGKIQGLISLEPIPRQLYIEMHLIESAPHNHPGHKQFAGLAGNMVAFTCKMSFELGFEGCVAFTAKTNLVSHYVETLGAEIIYSRNRMGIFTMATKNLVSSYYKDFFYDGQK
jgi:hypothetical protein